MRIESDTKSDSHSLNREVFQGIGKIERVGGSLPCRMREGLDDRPRVGREAITTENRITLPVDVKSFGTVRGLTMLRSSWLNSRPAIAKIEAGKGFRVDDVHFQITNVVLVWIPSSAEKAIKVAVGDTGKDATCDGEAD